MACWCAVSAVPIIVWCCLVIGEVRAERVNGGVRLPLQDPVPSGDAPLGAPGEVRIGVWAVGGDMRLFFNGRYQFGILDKSLSERRFRGLCAFRRSNAHERYLFRFNGL